MNNKDGFLQSRETSDIYASTEPQTAYNNRINFCLEIYNQSVKVCMLETEYLAAYSVI